MLLACSWKCGVATLFLIPWLFGIFFMGRGVVRFVKKGKKQRRIFLGVFFFLILLFGFAARAQQEPPPEDTGWLGELASLIWTAFADAVNIVIEAIICFFIDLLKPLLLDIIEAFPEEAGELFAEIKQYLVWIDDWVAINYGIGMLAFYFVFIIVQLPIKLVIKLFAPTVG